MKQTFQLFVSNKETRYQCSICTIGRAVGIDVAEHEKKVSLSPNGLVIYSDLHRCQHGILGINNLQIDHDLAIRSIENLQLPEKRRPVNSSVPGIPLPASRIKMNHYGDSRMRNYLITKMLPEEDFRIRILDERLRVAITIGNIIPGKEKMIALITSDQGTIELEYYPSPIKYNSNMEKWLSIMVNLLEKLPPTTLGLFIETLIFIHSLDYAPPSVFLIKQLKTILTSHETYFVLKEEDPVSVTNKLDYVAAKYGEEVALVMNELIAYLVSNPMIPLQYYTRTHNEDLVYLINLFLILEQEDLLTIERPGIVEEKIDEELSVKEK